MNEESYLDVRARLPKIYTVRFDKLNGIMVEWAGNASLIIGLLMDKPLRLTTSNPPCGLHQRFQVKDEHRGSSNKVYRNKSLPWLLDEHTHLPLKTAHLMNATCSIFNQL